MKTMKESTDEPNQLSWAFDSTERSRRRLVKHGIGRGDSTGFGYDDCTGHGRGFSRGGILEGRAYGCDQDDSCYVELLKLEIVSA
jgi:hypothetical protein